MEKPTGKILDFTVAEWNQVGAAAGREAREARFRKGLPVVIEVNGLTLYEYPDGTRKTPAEYDAEQERATDERKAG